MTPKDKKKKVHFSEEDPPEPRSSTTCANYCSRDLLPFKFYFFFLFGSVGCVIPYVSVFLKLMGQSPLRIGVISGIRPILAFFTALTWGAVVDRFKVRRYVFFAAIACWAVFFFALYMLPLPKMAGDCSAIYRVPIVYNRTKRELHQPVLYAKNQEINNLLQIPHSVIHLAHSKRASYLEQKIYGYKSEANISKGPTLLSPNIYEKKIKNSYMDSQSIRAISVPPNLTITYFRWSMYEIHFFQKNLDWLYEPSSHLLIFLACLFLICFGEICQPPASFLADTACIDLLREKPESSYSQQRAYGALGWALLSLLVGALLSLTRESIVLCGIPVTFSNYKVIAVVFIITISCAFVSGWFIPFKNMKNVSIDTSSSVHSSSSVLKVFCNIHYGSWLLGIFYIGFCNGIIWGFLFWHLENIGANQLMLGVDSFLTFIIEFIVFHISDWTISKLGHIGVMYLSLSCYIIRFIIYSSITNPWYSLIADTLQGFTFSICWSSFAEYGSAAVKSESTGFMLGIVHGTYFGLGNGAGHLFGGIFIQFLGAKTTFTYMAGACAVFLALFIIAQTCSTKPELKHLDYEMMEEEEASQIQRKKSSDLTETETIFLTNN